MLPNTKPEDPDDLWVNKEEKRRKADETVIGNAKAKKARLRLLKERNENYLAEQRDEDADEEVTHELRVSDAD